MKTAIKKLRSPLKWHGGKSYLARRIIDLMPSHHVYNEPFAGGLNVLLNKHRAPVEYVSDLNPGLMLFWRVMADSNADSDFSQFGLMFSKLRVADCNPQTFAMAKGFIKEPPWPLDQIDKPLYAANFLRWNRMSRGGLGKEFAWSDRLRGGQPGDLNSWQTCLSELSRVNTRMRGVIVSRKDALQAIQERDTPETLHYCDPPYLHETRTVRDAYAHEMTREQHEALLGTLCQCQGAVMLSGYRSTLYDSALAGWRRVEFDMPNHSGQGKSKQRRVECLWIKEA